MQADACWSDWAASSSDLLQRDLPGCGAKHQAKILQPPEPKPQHGRAQILLAEFTSPH